MSVTNDANVLKIKLSNTGRSFLQTNNFDKIISGVIENVYGEKYKIQYVENCQKKEKNRDSQIGEDKRSVRI